MSEVTITSECVDFYRRQAAQVSESEGIESTSADRDHSQEQQSKLAFSADDKSF